MEDKFLQYPRGSVIAFTAGVYSNFRMEGLVVAVDDLDLPTLAQSYNARNGGKQFLQKTDQDPYSGESGDYYGFVAWLIANGFALPVEHSEMHLGDYQFSEELVPES